MSRDSLGDALSDVLGDRYEAALDAALDTTRGGIDAIGDIYATLADRTDLPIAPLQRYALEVETIVGRLGELGEGQALELLGAATERALSQTSDAAGVARIALDRLQESHDALSEAGTRQAEVTLAWITRTDHATLIASALADDMAAIADGTFQASSALEVYDGIVEKSIILNPTRVRAGRAEIAALLDEQQAGFAVLGTVAEATGDQFLTLYDRIESGGAAATAAFVAHGGDIRGDAEMTAGEIIALGQSATESGAEQEAAAEQAGAAQQTLAEQVTTAADTQVAAQELVASVSQATAATVDSASATLATAVQTASDIVGPALVAGEQAFASFAGVAGVAAGDVAAASDDASEAVETSALSIGSDLSAGEAAFRQIGSAAAASAAVIVSSAARAASAAAGFAAAAQAAAAAAAAARRAGRGFSSTFSAGIREGAPEAVNTVNEMMAQIDEYLPTSDARRGPLSNLTASGEAFVSTFVTGLLSGRDNLVRSVSTLFGDVVAVSSDAVGGILEQFDAAASGLARSLGDVASTRFAEQLGGLVNREGISALLDIRRNWARGSR